MHWLSVHSFWPVIVLLGVVGTISSTIFLVMVLVAARRFKRIAQQQVADAQAEYPPVTVLKPVHGFEPQLEANLESFFLQDYREYEIVFGCRTADDPALAVVEKLRQRYAAVNVRIVLSGEPRRPNAKVYSLDRMIASSTNDYFIISDSDIRVRPDFLHRVIAPLLDKKNGLVTCLYQGVPTGDFWSDMEALGMSVELPSGVMVAEMMEGMKFALGAVMAVRRDALERIGGIGTTADYYSDDFVLGSRVAEVGHTVVLANPGVGHVLTSQTFRQTFRTQLRWMQSTRYSRPKGHLGTGLTYSTPFGLLALAGCAATGALPLGIALCAWSYMNRVVQCLAVGWGVIRDRHALAYCWIYPLRDLLGFFVWAASYLGGRYFHWRGELYRFTPGGRIEPASRKLQAAGRGA